MKATVFFFLLLTVTLTLASPQSGGPAGGKGPDGPSDHEYVPSKQSPSEKELPTPAPFEEASKQSHAQSRREEQQNEPQVAEDPEIDSQTLTPPPPPKAPQKREEADEGRHRFEAQADSSAQKRRPSSDDSAYEGDDKTPKAKREEDSNDEGRHRFEAQQNVPDAKRQNEDTFHTNVKKDDADYANRNRGGDHFDKRDKFSTDVKRRGGPPNAHHEQQETADTDEHKRAEEEDSYAGRYRQQEDSHDAQKRDEEDSYAGRNRGDGQKRDEDDSFYARNRQQEPSEDEEDSFHARNRQQEPSEDEELAPRQEESFGTDAKKRDDADYANRNRGGDHFDKRDKFGTDVKKRDEAPSPHYRRPQPNGRRADVPFYRPRATVTEADD